MDPYAAIVSEHWNPPEITQRCGGVFARSLGVTERAPWHVFWSRTT